ncbi:glucose-6-phosphate isomerase [Alkalimonas amylolytica]|uniref:Glucose-6-phosphate isomerase n=1 Tax=Alkalimonas amylolytica TaxID=152573 RepID=A0A1H3XCG2_ALKAM|nr:glucose-6-phosphate isomerase [Alkalimonas amylolytica]SDZ96364.1 glucose-6-phosphate isomerase [Alkalimonas amylolytica]
MSAPWQALQQLASEPFSLRQAFSDDPERAQRFRLNACDIELDYSKNLINSKRWQQLLALAEHSELRQLRSRMAAGEAINHTEQRSVGHMRLRLPDQALTTLEDQAIAEAIRLCRQQMTALVNQLNTQSYLGYKGKPITDLIWVGIGGSLLGPQMACEALSPFNQSPLKLHFAGNIDGAVVHDICKTLNPETCLVVVASKSFGTEETRQNALTLRQWFLDHGADQAAIARHFWATSSNIKAATEFGIVPEHILPMWDWVGGRYSIWSAIGLPLALQLGNAQFDQFLAGAHAMDQHFLQADLSNNMPVVLALLGIWYINGMGCQSQALLPYNHYLRLLPSYVQQLDMESNGKQVDHDGQPLACATAPVIWGDAGTNGQHAYHQLLHQSKLVIPADFILAAKPQHALSDHHLRLAAHCFAQTQALMQGKTIMEAKAECLAQGLSEEQASRLAPHKASPGNKPSNTMLLPELSPFYLGALLALYEHKVFCQGAIWQLNSFDQWGVELGKQLSGPIYQSLNGKSSNFDSSTSALMSSLQRHLTSSKIG